MRDVRQTDDEPTDQYCYLVSVRGAPSSITHGQKFCGFRVVAAFLMTVIFMILLRFW